MFLLFRLVLVLLFVARCRVVGFGLVVLCLRAVFVLVSLQLHLVCLCLSLRVRLLSVLRVLLAWLVGVRGFVLAVLVLACGMPVLFLLLLFALKLPCLVAGLLVLRFWCCLIYFWVLSVSDIVAFAGSRNLENSFYPLVGSVVSSVVSSNRLVSVGCCVGLDSAVLGCLPVGSGSCFASFGCGGIGSCSLSAVSVVSGFCGRGGSVSWWSGGGSSVALPVRLSARTGAVINSASVSAVVFFSSPNSIGSALACRLAVERGLPVFAFACGFAGSSLPLLGSGSWVRVGGSGVWSGAWSLVSYQSSLF